MQFLLLSIISLLGFLSFATAAPLQRQSNTCTSRRAWHTFSPAEKRAYLTAEQCLMKLPGTVPTAQTRFDDLLACHQVQADSVHGTGWFLPFHRLLISAHERLLRQECGYTGTQPYWDEERDAGKFSSSEVFDEEIGFGGGSGGCIKDGPFKDYLHNGPGYDNTEHCIARQISDEISQQSSTEDVNKCLRLDTFEQAWPCIELRPHYGGHGGVGGDMSDGISSPGDPLFYLHHTFLDRVWWRWQMENKNQRSYDISGYTSKTMPESGWVTATLQDELNMFGIVPNATVAEVMDLDGPYCVEYI
ncbi:Similar to Tyrosinase; acc. no. P07524 [Pyronema omphalodes CBS 100304]|uniref:Similar to Tyrosinase acc. no. P07524 n=1 Tax=Pyronema omphalodes (strain CBS 100304) TaxID=1076935 RepID=U4KW98_PYROM|nr:Similar to Tyrosinase; acc. no. P07524 [Pyronema omphalodes CBS 100304]